MHGFNGKSNGFSVIEFSVPHQLVALQSGLCTTYCGFLFTETASFGWLDPTRLCISKISQFLALSPLRTRRH